MNLRPWLAAAAAAALAVGVSPAASAGTTTAHPATGHPAGWVSVKTKGLHLAKNVRLPATVRQHLTPKGTNFTYNWSGYAAVGAKNVSLRFVSATYNVPSVNCANSPTGTQGTYYGEWIGLDGINDQTIEQTGVAGYCDNGTPAYYAFYDLEPNGAQNFTGTIAPGDAITSSIYYDASNGEYQLSLKDDTTGALLDTDATCPSGSTCHNSSAEVITEDPGGGTPAFDLADYGMENVTGVQVTAHDGLRGNLTASKLWSSSELVMEDGSNVLMSQPSALYGGAAFSTTWLSGA